MPGPVIWNGHITFGLVSVPVGLIRATQPRTTPFHLVHTAHGCLGRIRYRKHCELDGVEVPEYGIGRGYETPAGSIVPVTDADLDNVPLPTAHAIELLGTLPADKIDPRQVGDSSYYLAPGPAPSAVRPYLLLAEALARRSQVAVVKLALRGDRERLGMLRPLNGTLVVNVLRWADEVRPPSGVAPAPTEVNDDELAQALELIDACSVDTIDDIPSLVDHYAQALASLIKAKTQDRDIHQASPRPSRTQPVDLMAALQESVRTARSRRGEHQDES
ncbi:non-homologous end joining protein Ku [Streptomyces sp. NPDC002547]